MLVLGLATAAVWLVRPGAVEPAAIAVPLPPGEPKARAVDGTLSLLDMRSGSHTVNGRNELVKPELAVVAQVAPGQEASALAWFDGPDGPKLVQPIRPGLPKEESPATPFTPRPPQVGVRTAVLLASPLFQSRDNGTVATLTRQKNLFTLTVQTWMDDGVYHRNFQWQKLDLVPLGDLEAGDYELRIVQDDMFRNMAGQTPEFRYHLRGRQAATLKFTVAARNTAEAPLAPGKLPTLNRDQLAPAGFTGEERSPGYQPPHAIIFRLKNTEGTGEPKSLVQVGTFDFNQWSAAAKPDEQQVPKLEPPPPEAWQVYAVVVGSELPRSSSVSLPAVEWRGQQAVLHINMWIDPSAAAAKMGPALAVVPLTLSRRWTDNRSLTGAGTYTVRVEWTVWKTSSAGGAYQAVAPEEAKRILGGTGAERYEAKFTIR